MAQPAISDPWESGEPYERYVGRWSRQVAPRFLAWLNPTAGLRWLDLGCGTGAISAAVLERCAPALVIGVEPSAGFLRAAKTRLPDAIGLARGLANAIPVQDGSIDVVVSGLVLNFVPDPRAALREMTRVTRRGGTIGAYVWDYAGKMEFIHLFWKIAAELDLQVERLDEGNRFPICRPEALAACFADGGLKEVEVTGIEIPTRFASFEDYWQPFLGGQGPASAYVLALSPAERERLRDRLRQRLPTQPDGAIDLVARAWAVRGKWVD